MLVRVTCATQGCGPFHVRKRLQEVRASDHRIFYCPEGHRNYYPKPGRSTLDGVQRSLTYYQDISTERAREIIRLGRSNASLRGHITRLQNTLAEVLE